MVSQADMEMVAYTTGVNTPQRMSVKAIARFSSSQASLNYSLENSHLQLMEHPRNPASSIDSVLLRKY